MDGLTHAIGIDVGGTNLRAALISQAGDCRGTISERVPLNRAAFVRRLNEIVAHLDPTGSLPVGIGLPGRVDTASNLPVTAGYLDIGGLNLAPLIGTARQEVYLDNDASMALRAEMDVGAARGLGNVVILTIGTGIGGASALGYRIVRGRAYAGQFGHVSVQAGVGPRCNCGRTGCLETLGSGSALKRLVEDEGIQAGMRALALLDEASRDAQGAAFRVIERWASALRSGIDSLIAALDPDMVIIGGGLGSEAHAALHFAPARSSWFLRPVQAAQLGDRAGVVGAGLFALKKGSDVIGERVFG